MEPASHDIRAVFHDEEFVLANELDLLRVRLPSTSKRFLKEVGLPRHFMGVDFIYDYDGFETVEFAGPLLPNDSPRVGGSYYIIGRDRALLYLTLEPETGRMLVVPDGGWRDSGFVNASVMQFAACAMEFQRAVNSLEPNSIKTPVEVVARVRRLVARIDSSALTDPGSWWSILLSELELWW